MPRSTHLVDATRGGATGDSAAADPGVRILGGGHSRQAKSNADVCCSRGVNLTVSIHVLACVRKSIGRAVSIGDVDHIIEAVFAVELGRKRREWIQLHAATVGKVHD